MPRKVFISFLGTTDYFPSRYYRGKKFCSDVEKYVQIAALQYVQRQAVWTKEDVAYILLTKPAEERNWRDNGHRDRDGNVKENAGLESCLKKCGFPFQYHPVTNIPEGKNEKEIWQIFKIIHDIIKDGDELYFDITHGYRYLPMLVVVLGNYSKFLEKARVMHILYGNYEGRDRDENGNCITPARSPIVDLQSFSTLQDWTYAVADFINNGNADRMSALTYDVSAPLIKKGHERADALNRLVLSIKDFAKDMETCRGQNIVSGVHTTAMNDNLRNLQSLLQNDNEASVDELLIPVFGKIREMVADFDTDTNIQNGFMAVGWCINHRLYQQAITILQESVKNYFCVMLGYQIDDDTKRKAVEALFEAAKYTSAYMLPVEIGSPKGETEWAMAMKDIALDYDVLRKLRNDFNHGGFNERPSSPSDIEDTIKEKYESIKSALGI